MERSKGVKLFGMLIIFFGVYTLLGAGNYKQFTLMFEDLANFIIIPVYVFTLLYGICCVYCGTALLRLEDWSRKVIVALTAVSIILGFLLSRLVMANFKAFVSSPGANVSVDMQGQVYMYAVIFNAIVTIFELSIVYFFTRQKVKEQFA